MSVLGIDVGAGTIKFAVFSDFPQSPPQGPLKPRFNAEEKTACSYSGFKTQLLDITSRLKKSYGIEAVGIGVPGFISLKEHVIERSPNMHFLDGMTLEKDLAADIAMPMTVDNDANAAALGEYLALEEPQPAHFVHLTLGSGIGSGIVLNGDVFRGACGFAAELGHLLVNGQGRHCGCGNAGCAETESSESGIVRSYQEYAHSPSPLSSRDVFARMQDGDEAARQAFRRAGVFLGVLLAQIVYSLNPERIGIGGGVAAAGEALLGPAREELARRVVAKAFACTRIEAARLGNEAGMAGAAALARGLLL